MFQFSLFLQLCSKATFLHIFCRKCKFGRNRNINNSVNVVFTFCVCGNVNSPLYWLIIQLNWFIKLKGFFEMFCDKACTGRQFAKISMFCSVCTIERDLDGYVTQLFCAGSQDMERCQRFSCSFFVERLSGDRPDRSTAQSWCLSSRNIRL